MLARLSVWRQHMCHFTEEGAVPVTGEEISLGSVIDIRQSWFCPYIANAALKYR